MSGDAHSILKKKGEDRSHLFRDGEHAPHACGRPVFIFIFFKVLQDPTHELRVVYPPVPHRPRDVQRRSALWALFGHRRADVRFEQDVGVAAAIVDLFGHPT